MDGTKAKFSPTAEAVSLAVVTLVLAGFAVFAFFVPKMETGEFRVGWAPFSKVYSNERIIVPPRLVGDAAGTLVEPLEFDIYGFPEGYYEENFVPEGAEYYVIDGFDEKLCVAVPYGGLYYLFSSDKEHRFAFPASDGARPLFEEHKGSEEQAYLEAFEAMAYKADYIDLAIGSNGTVNLELAIALIEEYCDLRGTALLVGASHDFLEGRGYYAEEDLGMGWFWENGLSVSIGAIGYGAGPVASEARIGDDGNTYRLVGDGVYYRIDENDERIRVDSAEVGSLEAEAYAFTDTGISIGGLWGNGRMLYMMKQDGEWRLYGITETWIS